MNWIFEIFSIKEEQAKLISILISSMVAIFVVLLNQWFTSRRAKKDLLIEKIEELFSASNDYIVSCRELLAAFSESARKDTYYDYPSEARNNFDTSLRKIEIICGLYFPKEKFKVEDFQMWKMPILDIAYKGKQLPEGEAHFAFDDSWIHVHESKKKFNDLCKNLMKKYGH